MQANNVITCLSVRDGYVISFAYTCRLYTAIRRILLECIVKTIPILFVCAWLCVCIFRGIDVRTVSHLFNRRDDVVM